ncbi:MAG: porphobilinogen synthase, partial [Meiothermus sp.]
GQSSADPEGPVPQAIRAARKAFGEEVVIFTDVCLCAHTSHGHCGVLKETPRGLRIDNDRSLRQLAAMALAHAEAGADFVAPSDMMDGRVGYIRRALDEAGFAEVGVLSYAVKYASAFYGPFREAAKSAPSFGDRASYQMDVRNAREALREAALDEAEGADMLMVKPALAYLDILARLRPSTSLPLVAYNVSGEYAMLKAAAQAGVLDEARAVREALLAIKRAGADLIVSYHALEALEGGWL